jgi:hypothetical protein
LAIVKYKGARPRLRRTARLCRLACGVTINKGMRDTCMSAHRERRKRNGAFS